MLHAICSYTGIPYTISSPIPCSASLPLVHPHFLLPQSALLSIAHTQNETLHTTPTDALTLNTYSLLYSTNLISFSETLQYTEQSARHDIASNLDSLLYFLSTHPKNLPHIVLHKQSSLSAILHTWNTALYENQDSLYYRKLSYIESNYEHSLSKGKLNPILAIQYLNLVLPTPLCEDWAALIHNAISKKTAKSTSLQKDAEDLLSYLETAPALTENYHTLFILTLTSLRAYIKKDIPKFDLLGLDITSVPTSDSPNEAFSAGVGTSDKIQLLLARLKGY